MAWANDVREMKILEKNFATISWNAIKEHIH